MAVSSIVILGAGDIGAAAARHMAAAGIAARVVLVDHADTVAAGKALDIRQAGAVEGYTTATIGTADTSAVIGASAIVIADRHGTPCEEWHGDGGLALIRRIAAFNERAPIVCAGAGQGALIERSVAELGVPATRIFGSSPEALRAAVTSLTALDAGCAPQDIALAVLGRPPRDIIVPWDAASVAGRRAIDVLEPPAITRIESLVPRLWPPGPYTLGAAAGCLVAVALGRSPRIVPALVVHRGDVTHQEQSGMWPVTLGPAGIVRIVTPSLTPRDRVRLQATLGS